MAGRPSRSKRLDVWMNGILVGRWTHSGSGQDHFAYEASWLDHPLSRPISLSLPLAIGARGKAGLEVAAYFDNLLPDSLSIRKRVASRFGAASLAPFDLLEKIGRDCVGAVQLMPVDSTPMDIHTIQGRPLTEQSIETILNRTIAGTDLGTPEEGGLRLSIAGAQEKTALLFHEGAWLEPSGATPTTHIVKLPMGEVGTARADFSTSVENEWLCAKIMQAYGLPVAKCDIRIFGRHKVLIVRRFDRKLMPDGWIARIPQEDFCQVFGTTPTMKYEDRGGPSMKQILDKLRGSVDPEGDRRRFLMTQLIFWMLAAPDGHAKNFSIFLHAGDRIELTPLYDVLSAWPVIGKSPRRFQLRDVKLAMAARSNNVHYKMVEIHRRHWNTVAKSNAMGLDFEDTIEQVIQETPKVIESVSTQLPRDFPSNVSEPILAGLYSQMQRLAG